MVSGIGCSGRAAGYAKLDSFHTTHGRAIPFATGLKLANPELNIVVFSGDGDLFAIGGNHFIHAARRAARWPQPHLTWRNPQQHRSEILKPLLICR